MTIKITDSKWSEQKERHLETKKIIDSLVDIKVGLFMEEEKK